MKSTKLTVEQILELYSDCKRRYDESGLFGQFDDDEKYYELDLVNDLALPEEVKSKGVVLPTGRDIVDTCVDHTDINNVRVWVNKRGESEKAEDEMNLLRKFGLGVLYRNSVEASISPIRVGAKHYWLHGLAIMKDVWDADRWAGKPERKEEESEVDYAHRIDEWRAETHDSIPIVIQGINPRNIMLDPYYDGGMFVFETKEELCFNVRERFPLWGNPNSKKITDKVEHISFWTKDYRCELYDKEPVMTRRSGGVAKHTYGFIPYVPIDTGLGNVSSTNDLKKRYVGVLRYVRSLLLSESRDYSIGDVILAKQAFPWGYLKGPNAASVTEIFQRFGEYNALPDGVEIVDMAPKVPPDALLTWLTVSAQYLSAHAAPASVRGMGEQGVRSGADRRLLIAEASTRYQYSNEAFKHGIAKVLSNCARIMKNVVPGDINVWAKTPTDEFDIEIKKDAMREPFTYYVEFSSISEEDEYRRADNLERLFKSGLVTKSWARRQLSNIDWQAMEVEEEYELMKQDPALQQIISQYLQGKLMEAMTKRSTAESIANPPPVIPQMGMPQAGVPAQRGQQVPGRRLVPPIPNIPPLGSAQEIQNQLARMRSQTPIIPGQGLGGGGNR